MGRKETILEVKNLEVAFQTDFEYVRAVRGIDFDVRKGETLAIVGESGSGKTVTCKSIIKLLPKRTTNYGENSEIIFNGENLLKYSEKEISKIRGFNVSMIFQDPMTSLNPTMKIGKQIEEGIRIHQKLSKAEAKEIAINMLKKVKIPDAEKRYNQYPHEFSGGMRQRVIIAIALACEPDILIADEPTTALDVTIQAKVLELMNDLKKTIDTSVMFITHDLGVVAEMADRVLVMYQGQILETGTVYEIFDNPLHPYTKGLMKAVPNVARNSGELYSLPDLVPHPVYVEKEPGVYEATGDEDYLGEDTQIIELAEDRQIRVHLKKNN